ncbi:copper chaperone PCu(A)C [Lichenicoccus roseus]|uniref:Copper chaperone PCu(A)C n=1 Tax=Lichenicoccus roseus TaxID=2683649 RepID=A0A5R9JDR8_9PROT|nr:copper chaperone PCu(A)C [Lichenicoccus roseus]TLU72438.1 copper chaperone PCu(A)C [Lichenicoccus roseus]
MNLAGPRRLRCLLKGAVVASGLATAGVAHAAPLTDVGVSDGWMRALPGLPAAGYLTLHNAGSSPATLIGATSASCGSLSLHRTSRLHVMSHRSGLAPGSMAAAPGMTTMQPVAAIEIKPASSVRLMPGGYHLMCDQPAARVMPGATVPVTLHFSGGGSVDTMLPVRGPRGS